MTPITARGGFTLVELSVVLVILGLLSGGVLVGRDLIRAAELRAVLTERAAFQTAVATFELTYNCLPGDCQTATQFWGADSGPWDGGYYGFRTTAHGPLTADGNGDGRITIEDTDPSRYESTTAWQHLSNAKLVAGLYTGVVEVSYAPPGPNRLPSSRYGARTLWQLGWLGVQPSGSVYFPGSYGHVLILSDPTATVGGLLAADHMVLDMKIDDGLPGTGRLRGAPEAGFGYGCVRTNDNDPLTSRYDPTRAGCPAIFLADF